MVNGIYQDVKRIIHNFFLPNYICMVKDKLNTEKTLSYIQGDESFDKRLL